MSARGATTPEDRFQEFRRRVTAICKEMRMQIGGCGCCGSPWLVDEKTGKVEEYAYIPPPDEDS